MSPAPISLVSAAALLLAALVAPLPVEAQGTGKIVRIGRLSPLSAETDAPNLDAFRRGLRELGWVEGLVTSLAHPGGNVTGVTAIGQMLDAKRLELIKEAVPGVTRVASLTNPRSTYTAPFMQERERMAQRLGLQLPVLEATDPGSFEKAFAALVSDCAGALLVQTDAMFITHRRRIVELAAKSRVPAVYGDREFVDAGGPMFYGATLAHLYHDAAAYADRILKGAKPAKALGLTIPPSGIARADHLVE